MAGGQGGRGTGPDRSGSGPARKVQLPTSQEGAGARVRNRSRRAGKGLSGPEPVGLRTAGWAGAGVRNRAPRPRDRGPGPDLWATGPRPGPPGLGPGARQLGPGGQSGFQACRARFP